MSEILIWFLSSIQFLSICKHFRVILSVCISHLYIQFIYHLIPDCPNGIHPSHDRIVTINLRAHYLFNLIIHYRIPSMMMSHLQLYQNPFKPHTRRRPRGPVMHYELTHKSVPLTHFHVWIFHTQLRFRVFRDLFEKCAVRSALHEWCTVLLICYAYGTITCVCRVVLCYAADVYSSFRLNTFENHTAQSFSGAMSTNWNEHAWWWRVCKCARGVLHIFSARPEIYIIFSPGQIEPSPKAARVRLWEVCA